VFIVLTDGDNGQACYIRAAAVQAIRVLSPVMTEVVLAGAESLMVREAPRRVWMLIQMDHAGIAPTERTNEIGG